MIDYVNTLDVRERTDALETPRQLSDWLASNGLAQSPLPSLGDPDHRHAIELREALRTLMLTNNGGPTDPDAIAELERAARRGELGVHFTASGSVRLAPGAEGVAGALAGLLVPVTSAIGEGSWQRVKACRAADCHWAFYDRSRNHSGVWCEMAVCGNRTKVRAYRDRQ